MNTIHLPSTISTQNETDTTWIKTPYANLRRYASSGVYHSHAKILGKLVRVSLRTKSLSIAKKKLDALLASERKRIGKLPEVTGAWLFKQLADVWSDEITNDPDLKQRAKDYRLETLKAIRDNTDGIDAMAPAHFTPDWCEQWAKRFRKKYSGSRFNGCLQTLRAILQAAVERGLISENPTKGIEAAPIKRQPKHLPTDKKFSELIDSLSVIPTRRSALLVIKFLAYSGRRIEQARRLYPKHVDFKRGTILWPPIKHEDQWQEVPMIPQLKPVARELVKSHPMDNSPLLPIKNPRRALGTCCRDVGIPRLTNHDFRHFFTTKALEQGIPVPDVAMMRGDKDGGAMLLKNYFHSRIEHLKKVSSKMKV